MRGSPEKNREQEESNNALPTLTLSSLASLQHCLFTWHKKCGWPACPQGLRDKTGLCGWAGGDCCSDWGLRSRGDTTKWIHSAPAWTWASFIWSFSWMPFEWLFHSEQQFSSHLCPPEASLSDWLRAALYRPLEPSPYLSREGFVCTYLYGFIEH